MNEKDGKIKINLEVKLFLLVSSTDLIVVSIL